MSLHVLMMFLDGVGIGSKNADINPFFRAQLPNLSSLLSGNIPYKKQKTIVTSSATLLPLNATLGVQGFPQSGTGQTTLFTGVNAAKKLGQHFGPYPHSHLKPILERKNIFRQLLEKKKKVCFTNAYPKQFFEALEKGQRRYSVTTLSCVMVGMALRGGSHLKQGKAISADITNARWNDFGYDDIQTISPESAGERFYKISREHHFTLFEYFLPDHAGHSQDMRMAVEVLERFDGFLGGVLKQFDEANSLLIVTSDHGNVEDISTKSHTRNPVPVLLVGKNKDWMSKRVKNLTHITPAIVKLLNSFI